MKRNRKIQRNFGEAKPYEIDVKPPFYATKVIPKPFTHIRGRFRRILYVEHRRQGRRNVEFLNFSKSGSVRPLQSKSIPKTGLGGRRDSGTKKKGEKKDVKTTLTRNEKGRRKNAQATGRRGRSLTRGPDPATRTEPSTLWFPRPYRFSPKCISLVTAQPNNLDPRPASPVESRHAQPNPPALFLQPGRPVTRE